MTFSLVFSEWDGMFSIITKAPPMDRYSSSHMSYVAKDTC